jgi:dethiobiotin synthetase
VPAPAECWLIAGTGTEVGKTWVAVALAGAWRASGLRVAARKPAQSFDPADGVTDADLLAAASGEAADVVCPRHRWYEVAMAPPMAAEALGRDAFTVADLAAEMQWPDGVDVGLVETAGGVRSPIATDGDNVDLAAAVSPDLVVLVADAGLGTINAVRLAAAPFAAPVVVMLNRYDGGDALHRANRVWLAERYGFDVVVEVGVLAERVTRRA